MNEIKCLYKSIAWKIYLADRVGFEPTEELPPRRFSRPLPSTTRPPIQAACSIADAHAASRIGAGDHYPIGPPSLRTMAITAGRGGIPGWKSGQRVLGLAKVEPASSPGC